VKRILVVSLFLVVAASVFAQIYSITGSCVTYNCKICDARIMKYVELDCDDGFSGFSSPWCPEVDPDTEELTHKDAHTLQSRAVLLCGDCFAKYREEFEQVIASWLTEKQNENHELRKKNDLENKVFKRKQLKKKMNELKEEYRKYE